MVHPGDRQCIAILSKPAENLALRTKADVVGVAARLMDVEGIGDVIYVSMNDLSRTVLDGNSDLVLDGRPISVIYSRYDFSHPSGQFSRGKDSKASPKAWEVEWSTIERIEQSTAILSSNLGSRLANRRVVQWALTNYGGFDHFLDAQERDFLVSLMPEQWSLGDTKECEKGQTIFEENPADFVAKNILRPRTGSDVTQNRKQSGGQIVEDEEGIRDLFRNDSQTGQLAGRHYILYRKIHPAEQSATISHEGVVNTFSACSEVVTYGAFLAGADKHVLVNRCIGVAARTRPKDTSHPLRAALGYGAISACKAEMH